MTSRAAVNPLRAAHQAFVGSEDPLRAGLEICAQPPGNKLATLSLPAQPFAAAADPFGAASAKAAASEEPAA